MPLDEDQCKSEAVRLLWDADSLPKLLSDYVKSNGLMVKNMTVIENFSLRHNRMMSIRLRGRITKQEPDGNSHYARHTDEKDGRFIVAKMRRFALRVLHCPPKMSTSRGVVYVDFNVVLPAPVPLPD